jgi:large subunit ribosomal protein L35
MPKLKTKKSLAKRLKFTKTGKIKRRQAYKSHILSKKSRKRKRRLKRADFIDIENKSMIRRLLPYG